MTWFQIDDAHNSHRKVARLETEFPFEVYMMAHATWLKAGVDCAHRRNGDITFVQLVRLTGCPQALRVTLRNACNALVDVELLDAVDDDTFTFRNWELYNGTFEQKKSGNAQRQQRFRDRKSVTNNASALRVTPVTLVTQSNASSPHLTTTSPHRMGETHAREAQPERPKAKSGFGADELAAAIDAELREQGAGSFGQMLPGNVAHHALTVLAFFRRESEIQGRPPDELVRESVGDYLASDYVKNRKSKTISMKQWFEDPGRNTPWNRKKELQKRLTPEQDEAVWRLENNAMLYDEDRPILKEMGLLP